MTDPLLEISDGATPLTLEEREGLIPTYILLRDELNQAEQAGILSTERWAFTRRHDVLRERFLQNLHKRMFGSVWTWAGKFRATARNIGVDVWQIRPEILKLLDDTRYRLENTTMSQDEVLARFHHRLVWVHPFPNGNGRHARLATDMLAFRIGAQRCTWGQVHSRNISTTRRNYIEALRAADNHNIEPLLKFIRS